MTSPALNDSASDPATALDPRASFVVEACAGSGKTWLLVSRMLRILLDGVAPGRILAITFTRKAAREIEARLAAWLRVLAAAPDDEVIAFLVQRGLTVEAAREALPRARGLLQTVFDARPALTVTTFHGWFGRIVDAAPLTSGLAGMTLLESPRRVLDEAWLQFARHCAREPESPPAQALRWLLRELGQSSTRRLLEAFLARRAEWHALAAGGAVDHIIATLRAEQGAEPPDKVFEKVAINQIDSATEWARLLARNTDGDKALGQALADAIASTDAKQVFDALCNAALTGGGTPRQQGRKPGAALDKRYGAEAPRFLALCAEMAERMAEARDALAEWRAFELNAHGLTAGCALLDCVERFKRERRLMDFSDLEWHADRLLHDESEAAFIQARLDARYRHILLDEFQDTNPLQWRILRAWLDAYDATQDKPVVFMVGDPKQSIYRFRRADPRIFTAAGEFFAREFGARHIPNDETYRNAPVIVDAVNALFGAEPLFAFRAQRSRRATLPGRVEVLPLVSADANDGDDDAAAQPDVTAEVAAAEVTSELRDPLAAPLLLETDQRRATEAALLAARIGEMVGRWLVSEEGGERPARFGDVLILCRRRTTIAEYERALRVAGIPYVASARGGLLKTLEALDIAALLGFLAAPADDLKLAHSLRTPVFALSDEELVALAAAEGASWWVRLATLAAKAVSPAIVRAHALLASWLTLAASLPVHDLLDRIYFEGELFARYRAVVPAEMWPAVAANLDAFIALALQLDAGRYPSLPRFLAELARRDAADDEAPDEGAIDAADTDGGRVRIMTIHGAKGLEAPIVWLIDANVTSAPNEAYRVLLDWPPEDDAPRHFSFAGAKDDLGRARDALLADEAAAAARENLNLLYVALTRASQYLFVSGVVEARAGSTESAHAKLARALAAAGARDGVLGEARLAASTPAAPRAEPAPVPPPAGAREPVGTRRELSSAAQDHGTRLHAALEQRVQAQGQPQAGAQTEADAAIEATVTRLLTAPHLQGFFDPAQYRHALNEVEVVLADGSVGRIDRLVEREDGWWVLDYKSGAPDDAVLPAYRAQLAGYSAAIRAMFPHAQVSAALIYADGTLLPA